MHVIESIGPVLGIVAFVGLAVLAFLLFQQAREIRRVREWAGRAPERAAEAADAVQAAAEASRDGEEEPGEGEAPERRGEGRLASAWHRLRGGARRRYTAVDRRLPIDGRYVLALLVVAIVAAGVATSGFGLVGGGGEGGGGGKHGSHAQPKPTVAVINGTSVPGLAATVEQKVVKKAGYEPGPIGNANASVNATVVEYANGMRSDAQQLATAVKPQLGDTPVQPMTPDTKAAAGRVDLALVLGLDDAGFGGGG